MKIKYRDKIIESSSGKTILETIEGVGIKPFSMCRDGFCGTCKLNIVTGYVNYIKEPIAMLENNEILPCICIPKSDIEIK